MTEDKAIEQDDDVPLLVHAGLQTERGPSEPVGTENMWQMVSELLDGEKLPESINKALVGLCDGSMAVYETAMFRGIEK